MGRCAIRGCRRLLAALGLGALALAAQAGSAAGEAGAHAHTLSKGTHVTMADYTVPDLWLVRDDGQRVSLPKELDDGRPVVLNFIYTTCPGVCPIMSAVFTQFQDKLGAERTKVHMVSISIDPEQDTPGRLRDYARRFSAGPQWQHYTGTVAASVAVQKAFAAYRGDKMNHDPLTLMRPAPGQPWVRIDGFASALDLLTEYAALAALCQTAAR
jgi:protein SCO1/2